MSKIILRARRPICQWASSKPQCLRDYAPRAVWTLYRPFQTTSSLHKQKQYRPLENSQMDGEPPHKTYFQDGATLPIIEHTIPSGEKILIRPYQGDPLVTGPLPPPHLDRQAIRRAPYWKMALWRRFIHQRGRNGIFFFIFFFGAAGIWCSTVGNPFVYPETDSPADTDYLEIMLGPAQAKAQDFRDKLFQDISPMTGKPKWTPIGPGHVIEEDAKSSIITSGKTIPEPRQGLLGQTIRGSHRVMINRTYYNDQERRSATILNVGWALCGWPWVVHGGVIATILDECMGRCAIMSFPAKTGVTANLTLDYRRIWRAEQMAVVHTKVTEVSERKAVVTARLVSLDDGQVLCEASAVFVVPKKYNLAAIV